MRLTRKLVVLLALLSTFALVVACGEDPTANDNTTEQPGDKTPEKEEEKHSDLEVIDGKVRFYLKEKSNSTRTATYMAARDWTKSQVIMNGSTYQVNLTDEKSPRPYIDVPQADEYKATLLTPDSNKWYESTPDKDVKLPYSQFYHTISSNITTFPMYGAYTKATGNNLIFNDGFAMVYIRLKGSAKISSVKVDNPTDKAIAGISNLSTNSEYAVTKGMGFAVLNCTNKGEFVQLTESQYTNFHVMIAPGAYTEGLKITICDANHLAQFVNIEPITLSAGDVHLIEMGYAPDADLVYYEGFDNFVWGGDIMKGTEGFGYAPTSEVVTENSSADLSGYEDAFAEVAYDNAGTGFIQSNTWSEVKGKSVSESHRMRDSYVQSRNIADTNCMFRTQEYPGYIAVGTATIYRGIYTTPHTPGTKTIGRVKYTIQMALQAGFNGDMELKVINGGVIDQVKINGENIDLSTYVKYLGESAHLNHIEKFIPVPSSKADKKEWSTIEVYVNGATDGSRIYLADTISDSGVHGVYINSIEGRLLEEWGKKDGTVRVLLWNILCGMWNDQPNNYDNFVEWVKKYDPDICIWCESESIYKDNSSATIPESERFLPNGWSKLAARFGHKYAATGGNRDNFAQTVTAKFPITTINKITDTDQKGKPVSHGAGHFSVEINGIKLNIVSLHMWPQSYGFGVSSSNQAASTANNEGHIYREHEMQYIVNQTVNNPTYANEEYWIFGGDTNSRSRLDAWRHNYADDYIGLTTHDVVRNQTNLKDVIGDYYPRNYFMTSTHGSSRIDFLYASPKMFERIDNSITLIDEWCRPRDNGNARGWQAPSDHRPILIDFNMK